MFHSLMMIVRRRTVQSRRDSRPERRRRAAICRFENLEGRLLQAGGITDLTQLASQTPAHVGPTILYLNFDGGQVHDDPTNVKSPLETITPFEQEPGDKDIAASRDQDIQDILFHVSEVFSPFNVEVERIYGAGKYDGTSAGNTTVFIGGLDGKDFQYNATLKQNVKYVAGFTPPTSSDDPGSFKGLSHRVNSDPFDIAFIDPSTQSGSTTQTARYGPSPNTVDLFNVERGIAHEAGHTFGLVHVRADGLADPTTLAAGKVNDVMSYDSPNEYFANVKLPVTNYNNNAATNIPYLNTTNRLQAPDKTYITTQDSYTALIALLGARPADNAVHVAGGTDHPILYNVPAAPTLAFGHTDAGATVRPGDSDVFSVYSATNDVLILSVTPTASGGISQPEVLVYESQGRRAIASETGSVGAFADTFSFNVVAGQTLKVVVGGHDGQTFGGYTLNLYDGLVQPSPPNTGYTLPGTPPPDPNAPLNGGPTLPIVKKHPLLYI